MIKDRRNLLTAVTGFGFIRQGESRSSFLQQGPVQIKEEEE